MLCHSFLSTLSPTWLFLACREQLFLRAANSRMTYDLLGLSGRTTTRNMTAGGGQGQRHCSRREGSVHASDFKIFARASPLKCRQAWCRDPSHVHLPLLPGATVFPDSGNVDVSVVNAGFGWMLLSGKAASRFQIQDDRVRPKLILS